MKTAKNVPPSPQNSPPPANPPKWSSAPPPANDRQILTTATKLYGEYKLRRIYYTGFSPYPEADSRLPLKPPPP